MVTKNIFNTTLRGSLIMTGNGLIIVPEGSIYANPVPPPPSGSTVNNYRLAGSAATITIPATAEMFNTKLVWAGVTGTSGGIVVPKTLNTAPVTLTLPSGNSISVSPNLTWQQNLNITANADAYVNVADITSIVSVTNPNGFYTVRGIPSVPLFFAGWLLYLTYKDDNEDFRNINIWSVLSQINAGQTPVDIPVGGFITPSKGPTTGKLILAAGNGQPQLTGENILFGPSTSNLVTLSGPNNPAGNFFQSQINGNNGQLNTLGTLGTRNTPLGQTPISGERTLWDVTRIDATPGLTNNQTSAVIRTTTAFDSYWISSVGLQVDVNAANLSPVSKTVNFEMANIGETLTYTISFSNAGNVAAFDTVLTDTIPNGVSFIPDSIRINNVQQQGVSPSRVNLGTIPSNARTTITFNVLVITIPTVNPITNTCDIGFNYINGADMSVIHDNTESNGARTFISHVDMGSTKSVDKSFADVGDILTYTIKLTTVGNTTATNILFIDTIPNDTTYLAGTLKQDGVAPIGTGNPNPPGVVLPKLIGTPGVSTVVFQVKVNTIPSPNPILNSASTIFAYTIDTSTVPNRTAQGSSNTTIVSTQVNNANLENISKYTDKSFCDCGEVINYTILIPNIGNITAQNVLFKDTIPKGTVLINDSVRVNGVQQLGVNIENGVTIPDIGPSITASLTFAVKVEC